MRISLILVFALVCSATFAWAQDGNTPSPATTAPANTAPPNTAKITLPPANPATTDAGPPDATPSVPAPATVAPNTPAPAEQPSANTQAAVPPVAAPVTHATPAPKPPQTPAIGAKAGPQSYIIGPLDVLIVRIWNLEKLSGPFTVAADGMLSMPLVGSIRADGLTTKQLTEALTQRLKECCVIDPEGEVDIQLGKNNSKRYYVYGAVLRSGEFPLDRADLTIMDAMANIGGFQGFANRKKIYLLRGAQKFSFNYTDVIQGKHLEQNIVVQNGDRIVVPE